MADDDEEPDYDDVVESAEMEEAWESFLANRVNEEMQNADWEALVNQLQDLFSLGYDLDNGLPKSEREDFQAEFRNLLATYDIDLVDYDWDDWREWYDAQ